MSGNNLLLKNNEINYKTLLWILDALKDNEHDRLKFVTMDLKWKNFNYASGLIDPDSKLGFDELMAEIKKRRIKLLPKDKPKHVIFENELEEELYDFENISGQYKEKLTDKNKQFISSAKDYIVGLQWVHSYYYFPQKKMSTWYYKYHDAPTIKDLYYELQQNKNPKIDLMQYEKAKWFSETEHLIWVTPFVRETMLLFPNEVILKYNMELQILDYKLNMIASYIVQQKQATKYIDCTYSMFLTKCTLKVY